MSFLQVSTQDKSDDDSDGERREFEGDEGEMARSLARSPALDIAIGYGNSWLGELEVSAL